MALADLIKRPPNTEKLAATVAKLTSELDAAKARLEAASDAYAEATADELEGVGSAAVSAKAEADLNAAQREMTKITAALSATQARHRAALSGAEHDKITEAWTRAETLSVARTAQAAKVAKSATLFAADYQALLKLTRELYGALPAKPDPDAAFIRIDQVEIAVRREALRCGIDWALSWPWGIPSLPEFLPQFEGAATVISRWKASALAGKR